MFSIQASFRRKNSRCPLSGQPLPEGRAWGVFQGCYQLADDAASRVAPELAQIAALLADAKPEPAELRDCAVWPSGEVNNTRCAIYKDRPVERRPFEAGFAGNRLLFSIAGGEDRCPTIARALHDYFQTEPAPRPEPVPEPEPEDDDARMARLVAERRARLLACFAWALDPGESKTREERAELLLRGLDVWADLYADPEADPLVS